MGLILLIIFGALVGWVASLVMKTDAQQGLLMDIIVGIIGAVIGDWLIGGIGEFGIGGFDLYSFIVALIGACIFIAMLRVLRR